MTDNPAEKKEPKIIVDDDWKEQVTREKEQLQSQSSDDPTKSDQALPEMPPASFAMLVTTLSTQALAALGYVPDPVSGQPTVNRPMAKHFVDTLGVLEEKTKGNLSDDESNILSETLHQLRMVYVASEGSNDQMSSAAAEPSKPSIELP